MIPYLNIDIWDILIVLISFAITAVFFISHNDRSKMEIKNRDKRHSQYNPPSKCNYNYSTHYIDGGFNRDRYIKRRIHVRKRQRKSS